MAKKNNTVRRRILAFDPSLTATGCAVVDFWPNRRPVLAACGVKETSPETLRPFRLLAISEFAEYAFEQWKPDFVVREDFARNAKYGREESGMVAAAVELGVAAHVSSVKDRFEMLTVSPREAKLLVCPKWPGFSKANWQEAGYTKKFHRSMPGKGDIVAGLQRLTGLIVNNHNAADAVCVALCVAVRLGIWKP